jgi:hypothetical protein
LDEGTRVLPPRYSASWSLIKASPGYTVQTHCLTLSILKSRE